MHIRISFWPILIKKLKFFILENLYKIHMQNSLEILPVKGNQLQFEKQLE